MKPGLFKSATALVMIATLAAPLPGVAQDAGASTEIDISQMSEAELADLVERCRLRAEREANGEAVGEEDPAVVQFCAEYAAGTHDAALPANLQSATVLTGIGAIAAEVQDQVSDLAQALENTADTLLTPEAEPEAEATAEATAEAEAEAPVEPEASETAEAEAEVAPEAEATAEVEAEVASEAEATAEVEAETEVDGAASAEAETATDSAALAEALAVQEAQESTSAEGEATAEASTEAPVVDNPEVTELNSQEQADALAEAETAPAAAAAAAAGDDSATAEAEVVEETVTAETARSSDEEFATKVNETAEAAPAQAEEDKGLSKLEKAALLGLGALAVGQLLNSGEKVVSNSGDRAVVEQNGTYRVIKNDDALLRQPGSNVKTYQFQDGSTRTVVTREDGTEVETIRAADGRVLRRSKTLTDGRSVLLFDDTQVAEKVVVTELPRAPQQRRAFRSDGNLTSEDLAAALAAQEPQGVDRSFSLAQIRNIDAVRRLVPEINVDKVTFESGSAVIRAAQAEELTQLGNAMRTMIDRNPSEVFLIEGHTDATGAATFNLALSDRRAETVALALTEYFDVPPENMVIQGYGESDLAIPVLEAERANRRVAVRRITPLLTARQ